MSLAWLWSHAADLVWAHYGVSSKVGKYLDRRAAIPLGRIHLDEFVMLGENAPPRTASPFIYSVPDHLPHAMPQYLHAQLGLLLKQAVRDLSQPWQFPKTSKRSVARDRLRRHFNRLRCNMESLASAEHGPDASWSWYYGGVQ